MELKQTHFKVPVEYKVQPDFEGMESRSLNLECNKCHLSLNAKLYPILQSAQEELVMAYQARAECPQCGEVINGSEYFCSPYSLTS